MVLHHFQGTELPVIPRPDGYHFWIFPGSDMMTLMMLPPTPIFPPSSTLQPQAGNPNVRRLKAAFYIMSSIL